MPIKVMKSESEDRFSGTAIIIPETVSDKLITSDNMPDALKVLCRVKGTDDMVALFVGLNENAKYKLRAFIPDIGEVPTSEAKMRAFLEARMPQDEFLVYVKNGSVRSVVAAAGKHLAKFHRAFTYTNDQGQLRARITLQNAKFEEITWVMPWMTVDKETKTEKYAMWLDADTSAVTLDENKSVIGYLCTLGLDQDRFIQEMQEAEKAGTLFPYWEGDVEVEGFFRGDEPKDAAYALTQAVRRHGPTTVEIEVIDDKKYGIGPKRVGKFKEVAMERVVVAEGTGINPQQAAFDKELEYLLEMYENLTKVVLSKQEARFIAGGHLTEDGTSVAKGILKPIMLAAPQFLKTDGKVIFPPSLETWHTDGLVMAGVVAMELLKLDEETRFNVVNLNDSEPLLAWVTKAVPEFSAQPMEDDEALPL